MMAVKSVEKDGTTKKRGKVKEELTKIVLRRLPYAMDSEQLMEQLQPLPETHSFWFCRADRELLPNAFARAYIVFRDEKDAFSFAERFNGYVFVDKQGNESMAIVECAPNQVVPKQLNKSAKECDERVNTIANERYGSEKNLDRRGVTHFDELVRQIEEKQKRIEEGQVQETPLTAYIVRQTLEKGRKRQQKISEKVAAMSSATAANRNALAGEKGFVDGISYEGGSAAKETRKKERKRGGRAERAKAGGDEATNMERQQKKAERKEAAAIRRAQRSEQKKDLETVGGQMPKSEGTELNSAKNVVLGSTNLGDGPIQNIRDISNCTSTTDGDAAALEPTKRAGRKKEGENGGAREKGNKNASNNEASGKQGPKEGDDQLHKSATRPRLKDRPEREIYRPGQRSRLAQGKSATPKTDAK